MIAGMVILEDVTIQFTVNLESGRALVTVTQLTPPDKDTGAAMPDELETYETYETYETDSRDFLKALAIAVHPDGEPSAAMDYKAAERAQGPSIRWIP